MQFVGLLVNSGIIRQATDQNQLDVNVQLNSNPTGNSISGTGLWQVSIYPNTLLTGNGVTAISEITPALTTTQSGTSLVSGGQSTIGGIPIDLNLGGVACSDIPYVCVRVAKGTNPNPNFLLSGTLVGCIPSNCRGMYIYESY